MLRYFHEIFDILGPERRKLHWLILAFIGASLLDLVGLGLIGPYVTLVANPSAIHGQLGKYIVAAGFPTEFRPLIVSLGLALLGVFLLKAIAGIAINRAIIRYTLSQQLRLRSILMNAYQHMPYTEFLRRNSSEYVYSVQILTMQFANGVLQPILAALSNGIVAGAIMCLLAWRNPAALAALSVFLGILVYGYDRLFRRHLRAYGQRANDGATAMVRGIHEGIEGLKEIRILGREKYFHDMVRRGAEDYSRFFTRSLVIGMMPRYLIELQLISFLVLLIIVTVGFGQDQNLLIATLGVFGLAAIRLLPASTALSSSLIQLRFNSDAISRLYQDLDAISRIDSERPSVGRSLIAEPFQSLTLERVCFTYPNVHRLALNDVSLEIRAGESIGLIGPSGSGKTTLVDVILGLLQPQSGVMRYNKRLLWDALGEWRAQVAYLPQQVFLIDDTLRRNVALGVDDADIDDSRIRESLGQARLAEMVKQLPSGVATVLGERGVRLSGGQRQRVALARAFYHGRTILVMDEATSALDNETEREIVDAIRQLRGHKTVIVIAHRLTTVQHCDRIYRLDQGGIAEIGTPAQILRNVT